MRILHISQSDDGGGAARAAYSLHKGLRSIGCDSKMLVEQKCTSDENVYQFNPKTDPLNVFIRKTRSFFISRDLRQLSPDAPEIFSHDKSRFGSQICHALPVVDLINLHWVSGLFDYSEFFRRVSAPKLCWTLHDMNPFTGGCHYSFGCDRYEDSCGSCPQLVNGSEHDLSRQAWSRKSKAFGSLESKRLNIVTPSRWMAGKIASSSLLGRFPISVIPCGLDLEAFRPVCSKDEARRKLGLPANARIVFFITQSMANKRKGFKYLREALLSLSKDDEIAVLTAGSDHADLPGVPTFSVGFVKDDYQLSLAYAAADVTAVPSLEDNLPLTVLESLACGTPVAGFQIGGMPEMISNGIHGYLSETVSSAGLADAIRQVLAASGSTDWRQACRSVSVERYSLERHAQNYLTLYKSLV